MGIFWADFFCSHQKICFHISLGCIRIDDAFRLAGIKLSLTGKKGRKAFSVGWDSHITDYDAHSAWVFVRQSGKTCHCFVRSAQSNYLAWPSSWRLTSQSSQRDFGFSKRTASNSIEPLGRGGSRLLLQQRNHVSYLSHHRPTQLFPFSVCATSNFYLTFTVFISMASHSLVCPLGCDERAKSCQKMRVEGLGFYVFRQERSTNARDDYPVSNGKEICAHQAGMERWTQTNPVGSTECVFVCVRSANSAACNRAVNVYLSISATFNPKCNQYFIWQLVCERVQITRWMAFHPITYCMRFECG